MKNIFVWILLAIPVGVNAMCLEFFFSEDGQTHGVPCNSGLPEVSCPTEYYWNGSSCQPVPVIRSCKEQGGTWEQVQLRGIPLSDALNPERSLQRRSLLHICICPNKTVWDGQNCRSDIPPSQQCSTFFGDGSIRVTHDFFGPGSCPAVR